MTMTIDDEIQLQPATSGDGAIVPEGRYTMHLVGLEKAPPSTFKPEDGPRVKWIFHLYAENVENMERGRQFMFDGKPYEFWRTTSTKNSKRAFARHYFEALANRKLNDQEIPRLATVLDARMSAMITYEDDPEDATRQVLKMSGLRHVAPPGPEAAAPSPEKAPPSVAPDASDEDVDRALLVSKLLKSVKRLKALDAEAGAKAQAAIDASDLDEALLDDLKQLSEEVSAAVRQAMED